MYSGQRDPSFSRKSASEKIFEPRKYILSCSFLHSSPAGLTAFE